ncbi:hypothetical protein [Bradyrhizobium sp.]|jgi:hypothetical protein
MSDDALVHVQGDINGKLEAFNIAWLKLATADFEPEERQKYGTE